MTYINFKGDRGESVHFITVNKPHPTPHEFSSDEVVDSVHIVYWSYYEGSPRIHDCITTLEKNFVQFPILSNQEIRIQPVNLPVNI